MTDRIDSARGAGCRASTAPADRGDQLLAFGDAVNPPQGVGVPEPNTGMRLASQCDEANNRLAAAIRARGQV